MFGLLKVGRVWGNYQLSRWSGSTCSPSACIHLSRISVCYLVDVCMQT